MYKIVLVGLTEAQMEALPDAIISMGRTNSVAELSELYAIADVFVNPTYEDNYPTTNLEAISCGTPVITYDTGGSPESAEAFGTMIPTADIDALMRMLKGIYCFEKKNVCFDTKDAVTNYLLLKIVLMKGAKTE